MDIKEIALKVADSLRNKVDGISHMQSNQGLVRFAEALIESYKAELLKEVGEPVAFMCSDEELCHKGYERFSRHNSGEWNIPIFTSDQVAAAILKATGPMEEKIERLKADNIAFARNLKGKSATTGATYEHLCAQLAAAQEQQQTTFLQLSHALRIAENQLAKANQLWQIAQGRCDGLEEKLAKAEQRVAEAVWKAMTEG